MDNLGKTLFINANLVLDGFTELQRSYEVLAEGNRILAASQTALDRRDATIIDVGGRTLMPGLIDAHAHITGLSLSPRNISYPASEIAIAAANYLRCSLLDGFTSIREAGGADHGVARHPRERQHCVVGGDDREPLVAGGAPGEPPVALSAHGRRRSGAPVAPGARMITMGAGGAEPAGHRDRSIGRGAKNGLTRS